MFLLLTTYQPPWRRRRAVEGVALTDSSLGFGRRLEATTLEQPRAGWYRHPKDPTVARYWDGTAWVGEPRAVPSTPVPAEGSARAPSLPAQDPNPGELGTRGLRWLTIYRCPLFKDWLVWLTAVAMLAGFLPVARDYLPEMRANGLSDVTALAFALDLALPIVVQLILFGIVPGSIRLFLATRRRTKSGLSAAAALERRTPRFSHFVSLVVLLPGFIAFSIVASEPDESSRSIAPPQEVCSTLNDVLNSLLAYNEDTTRERAAVIEDDLRRLSMESNRSGDTNLSSNARDARTAWAGYRAALREYNGKAAERSSWETLGSSLIALGQACGQ